MSQKFCKILICQRSCLSHILVSSPLNEPGLPTHVVPPLETKNNRSVVGKLLRRLLVIAASR